MLLTVFKRKDKITKEKKKLFIFRAKACVLEYALYFKSTDIENKTVPSDLTGNTSITPEIMTL